jgi:murein DD-endopeptidase MepM/ murein hydrolase activator NlpD
VVVEARTVDRIAVLAVVVITLAAGACGTRGAYHRVKPGETLSLIGQAYGVSHREIAQANDVRDPSRIYPGQRLLIPGAKRAIDRPLAAHGGSRVRRSNSRTRPADAPDLRWPLERGPVTSVFGPRGSRFHDGIDIGAPVGSPVRAAAAGKVAYEGVLSGYGKVIIVRHDSRYSTVYAHNHRHYVALGQRVRRGERIAAVGRTGRVTGPNLHFEIRHESRARDPMIFLPPRGVAAG